MKADVLLCGALWRRSTPEVDALRTVGRIDGGSVNHAKHTLASCVRTGGVDPNQTFHISRAIEPGEFRDV